MCISRRLVLSQPPTTLSPQAKRVENVNDYIVVSCHISRFKDVMR